MIEMRWLDAPLLIAPEHVVKESAAMGIALDIPRQKILQFRFRDERTWPNGVVEIGPWAEWQDVPTVQYESFAAREKGSE